MFKTCTKCNIHLSLDKFHLLKKGKYGRHPQCKSCRKNNKNEIINFKKITEITCSCCGITKSINYFYKNKSNINGYQIYCKTCNKIKIAQSMSKLDNYIKIVLKKFKSKNKDKKLNININDIKSLFREQEGNCAISNHEMTHNVDIKQRTDNIWNLSIMCKKNCLKEINKNDIYLVCNLIYSTKKLYNLNENEIKNIYNNINNNN